MKHLKHTKFGNYFKPKQSKLKPKDRIPDDKWNIYIGDQVQLMSGRKDVGKRGKVLEVDREKNTVTIEGVNMVVKHVKPNVELPKGSRVNLPMAVPFSSVKLVDPTLNVPTKTKLVSFMNPAKRKREMSRLSFASQSYIPIPEAEDRFKKKETGPIDTPASLVGEVTFDPNIEACPFPVRFLNALEKFRRHDKEGMAL